MQKWNWNLSDEMQQLKLNRKADNKLVEFATDQITIWSNIRLAEFSTEQMLSWSNLKLIEWHIDQIFGWWLILFVLIEWLKAKSYRLFILGQSLGPFQAT